MTSSGLRRNGLTALTGAFLLLSGLSPAAFAQDPNDFQTADVRQDVDANVRDDTASQPTVGPETVRSLVEGFVALAPVRFLRPAGNKIFLAWVFPSSPIDVGIIVDDGVPF